VAGSELPREARHLNNVHALGFVKNMAQLYNAVDVMVLPSFYEPFGLVVVEALQCGTPVIISRQVGASALVDEQCGIVLENITPQAIAEAIEESRTKSFQIPQDFAQQQQLTLSAHIQALRAFASPS